MYKRIVSFILVLAITICTVSTAIAAPDSQANMSYEEAYKLATIINQNISYLSEEQKIIFDEKTAVSQGLDMYTAKQLNNYLENLDSANAQAVYKEVQSAKEDSATSRAVPAIIVATGKILAKAGLAWLAKKLYDWGAKKFCATYKNYNSVTKNVCSFLGQ